MKILFVYPSTLDKNGKVVKLKKSAMPPLILGVLHGLTPERHSVDLAHDVIDTIDFSKDYDLVGITALTTQSSRGYQIADIFRSKGIKVIIGGIHASAMPEEAKKHADSVVIGEVDNIWEGILDDCENNRLKEFYKSESFPDLKDVPSPKWDKININKYQKIVKDTILTPLFTSRGCPMGCKFCSVTKFFGKTYRTKPISKVLDEIDNSKGKLFLFSDDNIAFNPDYSRELFKAVAKRDIKWISQVSSRVIKHPDLIELAGKSGCLELCVGFESVNPDTLKSINKSFNHVQEYEELIAKFHHAGIRSSASFIIGFDEETSDQTNIILEFLKKNRVMTAYLFILTPLPGAELFEEMENAGRMIERDWSRYTLSNVVFKPKNFSADELIQMKDNFYKKFYSYKNIISNSWYSAKHIRKEKNFFNEFFTSMATSYYTKKWTLSKFEC